MITSKIYLALSTSQKDGEPLVFVRDPCEGLGRPLALSVSQKDGEPLVFLPEECTGITLQTGKIYLGVQHGFADGDPLIFIPCCGDEDSWVVGCDDCQIPKSLTFKVTYEYLYPPSVEWERTITFEYNDTLGFWEGVWDEPYLSGSKSCAAVRFFPDCYFQIFRHTTWSEPGCFPSPTPFSSCSLPNWTDDLRDGSGMIAPAPDCPDTGWMLTGLGTGIFFEFACSPFYLMWQVITVGSAPFPRYTFEAYE